MTGRCAVRTGRAVAGLALLSLAAAGCTVARGAALPAVRVAGTAGKPAILAVLVDASSAADRALLRQVVTATARPGEYLVVLSEAGAVSLYSGRAPRPPVTQVAARPAELADATAFQQARYRRALASWRSGLTAASRSLRARQVAGLRSWAAGAAARAIRSAARLRRSASPGTDRPAAGLQQAAATIATLSQSGVRAGRRREIVVLGPAARSGLYQSLTGIGVVVAGDSGSAVADAALQAALLRAGARQATVLTPATDGLLTEVMSDGLGGTVAYPLVDLSYGRAQYRLPASAQPALARLLYLLTVRYPRATATINGYTDDVPVPGGNIRLSWLRASQVADWLIRHHIDASRLEAIGHGAADPVAPERPGGQPLDRRVLVVIEPGLPGWTS